ncbi:unnamed protein product [Rhizophagus irregularis]|nr:unnamed protein product [Rhizophagus irregularis]
MYENSKFVIERVTSTRGTSYDKEDLYNADASFPENVRNESGESSKIATSGEVENGSETIQTSRHSSDLNVQANDQEVDVAEIDNIIVKKAIQLEQLACLNKSEFILEEIWKKVMERLKEETLRVHWTKIEWNRILKLPDYSQLFNRSSIKIKSTKMCMNGYVSDPGQIRSLDDLEQWKAKFSSDLKSIDADLIFKTMEFFNQ